MRNEHLAKYPPRPPVMKHNATRESQPQPTEQRQPRRRSVYDCDGEYEFLFAQHWNCARYDAD